MLKGILTNTMKIQRHEAKLTYVEEIKSLYDEGMLPTDKEKKKEWWIDHNIKYSYIISM